MEKMRENKSIYLDIDANRDIGIYIVICIYQSVDPQNLMHPFSEGDSYYLVKFT